MSRRIRPTESSQRIKEEQIGFLLEDVKINLEEYKKVLELKGRQLSNVKKNKLQNAKVSYDNIVKKKSRTRKIYSKYYDKVPTASATTRTKMF